jgi:hypothetical protein
MTEERVRATALKYASRIFEIEFMTNPTAVPLEAVCGKKVGFYGHISDSWDDCGLTWGVFQRAVSMSGLPIPPDGPVMVKVSLRCA